MMTPSRVLASAVLLAATCCPDPAEAFMPMRRAAPNNVVDRGAVDGTPKRRDAFQPTGFFARVPLTNGGNVDAKSMQTLFRAPTARDHADSSRGTACPLRLFDVFHMVEACDLASTSDAGTQEHWDQAVAVVEAGGEIAITKAAMAEKGNGESLAVSTVEMADLEKDEGEEEVDEQVGELEEEEEGRDTGKEEEQLGRKGETSSGLYTSVIADARWL